MMTIKEVLEILRDEKRPIYRAQLAEAIEAAMRERDTEIDQWRTTSKNLMEQMLAEVDQMLAETEQMLAEVKQNAILREAVTKLLACPAIADENHSDPEWGCAETREAEAFARAVIAGREDKA